jgi:hypothetical protein
VHHDIKYLVIDIQVSCSMCKGALQLPMQKGGTCHDRRQQQHQCNGSPLLIKVFQLNSIKNTCLQDIGTSTANLNSNV